MILKTLGKTTWDKIKVGEVFAHNSCWCVFCKMAKYDAVLLAQDWGFNSSNGYLGFEEHLGNRTKNCIIFHDIHGSDSKLYKLPLSVQNLWRED